MHLGKVIRTENVVDIEDIFVGDSNMETVAATPAVTVKEFAELS